MREIEILAPAGSIEGLYGALRMGADAVYVGTKQFGARAFADNPSVEELTEALLYAHLRKKKIYLTVNTLLTDRELEEKLYPMLLPLYEAGLDACIVQDMGVLKFLHQYFPDMDLHASTQMTLFSGEEAELLRPYGVTRYVPARELTIEEIREARRQTDLEIEVFVHGALCYCYSGQCLMSQVIGGRSGNRGMCAQPCRLKLRTPYGEGYFLSTKDTCTLMHIPELADAGIDSFKIEGRMKRKEYGMFLSHLYRKYTDTYLRKGREYFTELREDKESELWRDYRRSMDLYNRGGFSDSYLFEKHKDVMIYPEKNGHFGVKAGEVVRAGRGKAEFTAIEQLHYQDILEFREEDGTQAYEYTLGDDAAAGTSVLANVMKGSHIYPGQAVYRTRNQALLDKIREEHDKIDDSFGLRGRFLARKGEPAELTVSGNGVEVTVRGDLVQEAARRPVSSGEAAARLDTLGGTSYRWEELEAEVEAGCFLPMGGLKELRRRGVAEWEERAVPRRKAVDVPAARKKSALLARDPVDMISVAELSQLRTALKYAGRDTIFHLKLEDIPSGDWEEASGLLAGRRMALSFPRILRGKGKRVFEKEWEQYGGVFMGGQTEMIVVNSYAMVLYAGSFFPDAKLTADTNLYQENRWAAEAYAGWGIQPPFVTVYGRVPVMVTEGCLAKTLSLCGRGENRIPFTTPKGDKFVVVNHCKYCYNTIYTEQPAVCVADVPCRRMDLTWEREDEVRKGIGQWNF